MIAGLAWSIIIAIIVKCTGIVEDEIMDDAVYAMNFALKALLPMLIAGIGVNSLNLRPLRNILPFRSLPSSLSVSWGHL